MEANLNIIILVLGFVIYYSYKAKQSRMKWEAYYRALKVSEYVTPPESNQNDEDEEEESDDDDDDLEYEDEELEEEEEYRLEDDDNEDIPFESIPVDLREVDSQSELICLNKDIDRLNVELNELHEKKENMLIRFEEIRKASKD